MKNSPQKTSHTNFVTVRAANKPKRDKLKYGLVYFNPKESADEVCTFYNRLVEIVEDPSLNNEEKLSQLRKNALQFQQNDNFFGDEEKIYEEIEGILSFLEWLQSLIKCGDFDFQELVAYFCELSVEFTPEQLSYLWASLIAIMITGGDTNLRDTLIWIIRTLNFIQNFKIELKKNKQELKKNIHHLVQAKVILPKEIFPLPKVVTEQEHAIEEISDKEETDNASLKEAFARLSTYQTAIDELDELYIDLIEEEREKLRATGGEVEMILEEEEKKEEEDNDSSKNGGKLKKRIQKFQGIKTGVLNQDLIKKMSAATQMVLIEAKIKDNTNIPNAINKIEQVANKIVKRVKIKNRPFKKVVNIGGTFWVKKKNNSKAASNQNKKITKNRSHDLKCKVKPLGIGDLRRVEQELCCYIPGEIAHIENIIKGESKEYQYRHLLSKEDTFSSLEETEKFNEKYRESTDRYEIEQESARVIQKDVSLAAGVTTSGQYGPTKVVANADFAASLSSNRADQEAVRYAKEVTEQATQRIIEKVREERSTKILEETETKNTHRFDNTNGKEHIVAIFRWVTKKYKAKVVNYGKRFMIEFMCPFPANFYWSLMEEAAVEDEDDATDSLEKPIDPRSGEFATEYSIPQLSTHLDLNRTNFGLYTSIFSVAALAPPREYTVTTAGLSREELRDGRNDFAETSQLLKIPEGYKSFGFSFVNWRFIGKRKKEKRMIIGDKSFYSESKKWGVNGGPMPLAPFLHNYGPEQIVPITMLGEETMVYGIHVSTECKILEEVFEQWQIETFDLIIKEYERLKTIYDNALAQAQAQAQSQSFGINIQGNNPDKNRKIEQLELKKNCIMLMTGCNPKWSTAIGELDECGYPTFDCCQAIEEGKYIQFVEQFIEWDLMSYLHYPYFWYPKCDWKNIWKRKDFDPKFEEFLQAGYTRVLVPVRPGYEEAALKFLDDGTIWDGGEIPGIDDPLYISIVEEMREPVGEIDPCIEPWDIMVPTNLKVLQCESGCVEGNGLPCPCEEEEKKSEPNDETSSPEPPSSKGC